MALPGVRTVLKDRFFTLTRTDIPETTRLVVIGRRNNDPTYINDNVGNEEIANPAYEDETTTPNEPETIPNPHYQRPVASDFTPMQPRSEEQVIRHFGENSELHRGFLEATAGGAPRVHLVSWGTTGTAEGFQGESATASDSSLLTDVDEVEGSSPFDRAFEAAEAIQADIIVPWGRGANTSDAEGTSDQFGFHAGREGLVNEVANKCKEITDRSNPCFAVMGARPLEVGETLRDALAEDGEPLSLTSRETVNNSYVAVVASELQPVGYKDEWGYSNGAALYAGFLTTLNAEDASTGKRLFNVRELRYAPTRVEQEQLTRLGFTPIKQNFSREAVVVDGVTFGKATSDYTRLSTLRIVFAAIQLVRSTAENYVGYPATMHHRNAMDTAIGSQLRGMLITGALIDADYNIQYAARENTAYIDLVLTPAFEMRNIEVSISIRL